MTLVGDSDISETSATGDVFSVKMKASHFDLAIRANGKAEIYFHSYFWTTYLDALAAACNQEGSDVLSAPEIVRMRSLSTKPQLVIERVMSMPFGLEEYNKFVQDFGGNK